MAKYDFDLLTIGAGSGGVAASRRAGGYGARAAICEAVRVGGTCVLRGCVPKKLLVYGALVADDIADAAGYGWTITGARFDWPTLITNKNRELDRLNAIYEKMLADAGVQVLRGHARLVDPHGVVVALAEGERRVTAETIVIATGGGPELPRVPGIEHAITSDQALDLPELPGRIVIVGGGYIAVEFAGIFGKLGAEVVQVIRGDVVLRGFDHDLRVHLQSEMQRQGITMRPMCKVTAIRKSGNRLAVETTDGVALDCDAVLYATGRKPTTGRLGLDDIGVATRDNGAIVVDEWSRSLVDNIYAIGDCTDRRNLTPVAIAEGRALVDGLYNGNPRKIDYANIASAVFSQPAVATVGLSEDQARVQYGAIDVYRSVFRPMKNTLSGNPGRTLMKLVVERAGGRVVGAHMVGPDAAEIIQGLAVAITCGATKAQFDATLGIHPTAAEEFVTMSQPVAAE